MRIGIIMGKIYKTINRQQLSGILEEAFSRNISACVFTVTEEYNHPMTAEGQKNLFRLIQFPMLDGVIYVPYSFSSPDYQNDIERFLQENCPKPVVRIGLEQKCFVPVWYHDRGEMREITRHLIRVHQCRKLLCLTGSALNPVARERLAGFRDALEEAHIPYQESQNVVYGDFYIISAQNLAQEFAEGSRPLPDAVVCANDSMAVALCDALKKNHISVPEDIFVTGYDGSLESQLHSPAVTTYSTSWKQLGRDALCQLYALMTGKMIISTRKEPGMLLCRESCGCRNKSHPYKIPFDYSKLEANYLDSRFSSALFSCTSLEQFMMTISQFLYLFMDTSYYMQEHYCLCLCEDWCSSHAFRTNGYSDKIMQMHQNGSYTLFPSSEMIPPEYQLLDTPNVIFFTAMHFQNRCFGYSLLQLDGIPDGINMHYLKFCRDVSNGLEVLRVRNVLQSLAYHDYLSQVRDTLTGLYNLTRLPHIWDEYRSNTILRKESCFWAAITIHGLYRLAEMGGAVFKDKLLVSFAELIQNECSHGEKCFRAGESDFLIMGSEPMNSHYHHLLIQNIKDKFEDYQRQHEQVILSLRYAIMEDQKIQFLSEENVINAASVLVSEAKSSKPSYSEQIHYIDLCHLRHEIYQNPEENWSTLICSQKLNLSNSYFHRIYLNAFGVSCAHDIRQSKLEHAKFLLLHTTDTLQEIARKCGYDYSHFMRAFRKQYHMTPTEYRRGR